MAAEERINKLFNLNKTRTSKEYTNKLDSELRPDGNLFEKIKEIGKNNDLPMSLNENTSIQKYIETFLHKQKIEDIKSKR
jgi:hypothetical protein